MKNKPILDPILGPTTGKALNTEALSLYESPKDSPGYLLWQISTQWRSAIEDTLKEFDLTHPQFVVLATTWWLTGKNDHIAQIDISKASGLDPNTTSQILRTLEAKKFIMRVRSLNERSKNPKLTPLGSQKLASALPAVENSDKLFFNALAADEAAELIKIFQNLTKSNINGPK